MTAARREGTCDCGEFRYAGHRCPIPPPPPPSETARLRAQRGELSDVMARVNTLYGLVPWERGVLSRLADAEQERIAARLAELETEDVDG